MSIEGQSSLPQKSAGRYVIGIDLGTTNCALAYIDTQAPNRGAEILAIPQWETEGTTISTPLLPSFYFLPVKAEWRRAQLRLPMHRMPAEMPPDMALGRLAQFKASQQPGRVIHAAKSWLCHPEVDREARILPWHSDEVIGDDRRSPVEVSAAYLAHLRDVWDSHFADPFAEQDIIITVPASFDEAAQRLTLKAAALAGYPEGGVRLVEEPQAAFYQWLSALAARTDSGSWAEALRILNAGQLLAAARGTGDPKTVLICDVGGGTTDFSLFAVHPEGQGDELIRRIAVSEHLLLGGDNIDLALARRLEARFEAASGRRLGSRQWAELVFAARGLKEKALSPTATDTDDREFFVAVAGDGAGLFASALTVGMTRREVLAEISEGFFPQVERYSRPRRPVSGLRQIGLPYAADSAITRHLAAFLAGRDVDAVLYTGGTLKPAALRAVLTGQIGAWQARLPLVLNAEHLPHGGEQSSNAEVDEAMDLAVAKGAAVFGAGARGLGPRILGGYPRSLYVEVAKAHSESAFSAAPRVLVCLVPMGYVGDAPLCLSTHRLAAWTGRPVRFQLYSSTHRPGDKLGDMINLDVEAFHALPPLLTQLDYGAPGSPPRQIGVNLEVTLHAAGILQVFCTEAAAGGAGQRWQLDFNLQGIRPLIADVSVDVPKASVVLAGGVKSEDLRRAASERIEVFFGKKRRSGSGDDQAKYLVRDLEALLDLPRDQWTTAFLRDLWPPLASGVNRRGRSLEHEVSWLYLAGFALRPGYGVELDEWRIAELWRIFAAGLSFPKERQAEEQWWIMWRRVAGGLKRAQQQAIFERIFPALRKAEVASPELYQLAGSLERLEMSAKVRLGQTLTQQIASGRRQFMEARIWALARVASRVPLYGGPEVVVRPKFVADWWRDLRDLDIGAPGLQKLTLFLTQGGRLVNDREFDLDDELRQEFQKAMRRAGASEEALRPLQEFVPAGQATMAHLFGESLPAGLMLS